MTPQPLIYEFDAREHKRWIILDRDGTLNHDDGYTHDPEHLRVLPGVIPALARLSTAGVGLAIASNQAGLARGRFTRKQMEEFNTALVAQLMDAGIRISGIAVCPHHPEGTISELAVVCPCRKPEPGMLTALGSRFGFTASDAMFVGNSLIDEQAAQEAGMSFMWGRDSQDWQRIGEMADADR